MRSWITTIGPSPFAVINTFWAAAERDQWIPDKIFLVYNDQTSGLLPGISSVLEAIVHENGGNEPEIRCTQIDENDLAGVYGTYKRIIDKEKKLKNQIAIDITPGRKYMSAFSLYAGMKDGSIDRIYYMHIKGKKFMNRPYPMIPYPYCELEDIVSLGGMKE